MLYCSVDPHVATPILDRFHQQTGITIQLRGDTEATKTTGLIQRLRTERARPRADVLWSSEQFMTIALAREGILAPHLSSLTESWPAALRDRAHLWHAFALRARVLAYSPDRVSSDQAPRSMADLSDSQWHGRIVMARPAFGTTNGHMAALLALWGEADFRAWLEALKQNDVRLLDGNAAVVRALAMGEADIGLTDTDDVWAGRRNGWSIELTYIRHDSPSRPVERIGPMLIPNTVALIAGAPHPKPARALIDFLLSEEVERSLAESDSHNIPIRPEVMRDFTDYAVQDPMQFDPSAIADAIPKAQAICREVFRE